MGRTARLFVISGPSGVGKGTLVSRLRATRPDLGLAVSATTREPREGEIPDVSYHFMTKEQFRQLADQGGFLEWDDHFAAWYGTPWDEVRPLLDEGRSCILEIDVNGGFNVRKAAPDAVLIFIAPPSLEELEKRLRGRKSEDEKKIANRLERAAMEMERSKDYDVVLVNDGLDEATDALLACIANYEMSE